jgi:hypothetical protein
MNWPQFVGDVAVATSMTVVIAGVLYLAMQFFLLN